MTKKELHEIIASLDPIKDHLKIVQLNTFYEFPWDNARSLEFALFRTFAIGFIGKHLHKTQEFELRTQKRYDDTDLLLSEIIEHGYDSERGKAALLRMNTMHGHNHIPNEHMVYVLSTFVLEPYRWNLRFGYRKATENEKIATYQLWFEIGTRMGIKNIPENFYAMEQMNIAYEQKNFSYTDGGRKVADATINLMLSWYFPKFSWPFFRPFMIALMDDHLIESLQLKKPSVAVRFVLNTGMSFRKTILKFIPLRQKPYHRTKRKIKSYPNGYTIPELGVKYEKSKTEKSVN
jgi:hypothetical protein